MHCKNFDDSFYGTATIGDRGQVVIPAEARQQLDWQPGEKLLVMRHPMHDGIMMFKIDAVREFLDEFTNLVQRADEAAKEGQ